MSRICKLFYYQNGFRIATYVNAASLMMTARGWAVLALAELRRGSLRPGCEHQRRAGTTNPP